MQAMAKSSHHFDSSTDGEQVFFQDERPTMASASDKKIDIQVGKHGVGVCNDPKRGERLLQVTSQCWQSGLYSDVTVIVGERRFPANRVVLVALSDFFRPLFQLDVKDSEVVLTNVDPDVFSQLLQFAYTGQLELQADSVQNLLVAADYLNIGFVKSACEHFMIQKLDVENVCDVLKFTRTFSLLTLADAAFDFMKENLKAVSKTDSFPEVNPEYLVTFFESDDLVLYNNNVALRGPEREKLIFKSVLRYLSKKPDLPEEWFSKLLESVRLPILPVKDMDKCFKEFKTLRKDERVQSYIFLREEADEYLKQLASKKKALKPDSNIPPAWFLRRKFSSCAIEYSERFASGGQITPTPRPPKPLHSDPDLEISTIDLWIRRWDGRPVIGAIKIGYRSPRPGKDVWPYSKGKPDPRWEHHLVELFPREFICKVIIGCGYLIDRLGFHTTAGRLLGPFGGPGGNGHLVEGSKDAPGYLRDIVCDKVRTQGTDAILNLQLYWLKEF